MGKSAALLLPALTVVLAACGGGGDGDPNARKHKVVYTIGGTAKSGTVSYTTPSGTSKDGDVKLPWRKEFEVKGANPLSVNGQGAGGGDVTCSITVDGKEVAAKSSTSGLNQASCDSFTDS